MATKKYTVRFFSSVSSSRSVFDCLLPHVGSPTVLTALTMGDSAFQIRELKKTNEKAISGALVKFRDEVPLVGDRTTNIERLAQLATGEEILEKNYFIFFKGRVEILAFHMSREGGYPATLRHYLANTYCEEGLTFEDIMTPECMDRVMNGVVKSVEFTVAKPKTPQFNPNPEDSWTQESFNMMNEVGATRFNAKISTRSRRTGLEDKVKRLIKSLSESEQTRSIRVKLSEVEEPIDLFAERIHEKINVTLAENRPDPRIMILSMIAAKERVEGQLKAIFGENYEEMDIN